MDRLSDQRERGKSSPGVDGIWAIALALTILAVAPVSVLAQSRASEFAADRPRSAATPAVEVMTLPMPEQVPPPTLAFPSPCPVPNAHVDLAPPTSLGSGTLLDSPQVTPGLETCPSPTPPKGKRFPLEASWDNGLFFTSSDNQFRIHVGGNAQVDSTWLIGPTGVFAIPGGGMNGVENSSATFLRRVRLRLDGEIYDQFDYIVEYDFANAANENEGLQPPSFGNLTGAPAPANIWMQIREVPFLGNVRIGYQVKPIGLTNNTNQAALPFLERADNNDAFYGTFDNGFSLGVTSRNWAESERLTWQYGIYRPVTNVFGVGLNKGIVGSRLTGLPWYEDEGRRLLHVGLGFMGGELVENNLRRRARPLLRNGPGYAVPILVDTGQVPGSRQYIVAPEFALVMGSVTVQAEWAGQLLTDAVPTNGSPQGTIFYHGGYVQALYFLTGEHQEYEKREGSFGRVIPNSDYYLKRCDSRRSLGAWQVGLRFSYLDLNDKAIQGGQLYDWTVGLNWFLNPNMKVQFNYILEHREAPQNVVQGWINGLGVRAAYDF